jgi:antitoxin component of MazEF toxin-antitoxin module
MNNILSEMKVIKLGTSQGITLPPKWMAWNHVKLGDTITIELREVKSETTKEMQGVQKDSDTNNVQNAAQPK